MGIKIIRIQDQKEPPTPIPAPPAATDGEDFFSAVEMILGEGTGQQGDPTKKFVTIQDLTDPEFIKYLNSQPVSVTHSTPAIQPNGIATDNAPDAPRNLQVLSSDDSDRLGAFCNHLFWENPDNDIDDISGVEIWVAETQNRSDAVFTGLVTYPSDEYQHGSTDPSTTYYYWIRAINWGGQYSEWEPSSDQGGLAVKGSETIGETAQKVINALKGETPATYSGATEYQIGDQVKYQCSDGSTRSYECIADEPDLITDGDLSDTSLGTEKITAQADRDFSSASNWTNTDINSYDETGDLTITADAVDQYCTLDSANAAMTAGKLYKLTFTVANLTSQWRITDDNNSHILLSEVISGANTVYFIYAGTGAGGLRIYSNNDDSSADFDDFSIKNVYFTNWTKDTPGWNVGLEDKYTSPLQATSSPLKEEAHCDGEQSGTASLSQAGASFTESTDYIVRFTIRDYEAGTITPYVDGTAGTGRTANGNYQETITAGASGGLVLTASSDFIGTVDSIIAILASGGSGITGMNPEYYYPLLWKRIGILSSGDVDGEATVGVDGNLVVDGTILARHMEVDSLSAVTADLGTVTAGVAKSNDGKFYIDFNERWLKVYDNAGTLRVHLGFINE